MRPWTGVVYPGDLDDHNSNTTTTQPNETNYDQLLVLFRYPNPSRPCVQIFLVRPILAKPLSKVHPWASLDIYGHFMLPGHVAIDVVDAPLGADAALGWLVWLGCQRWLVWWRRIRWRRRNSVVSWCGRWTGYRRRWFWGHTASLHGVVLLLGICSATGLLEPESTSFVWILWGKTLKTTGL